MKRVFILCLLLCVVFGLFAQEGAGTSKKVSIGVGPEWNMNSRENFAMGGVFGFTVDLPNSFAVGLTAAYSNNFSGIQVIEPSALFRWYFLSENHTGLFVQADVGAYLVLEDGELKPMFSAGLHGGIRLPLGDKFFVEPFGRVGYPFAFGVGALIQVAISR